MLRRNSWVLILSIVFPLMLLFGVILLIAPKTEAAANATIVVDTTIDDIDVNGNCTLREAIIAANTDTAVDACLTGSGADTILLPTGVYTLSLPGFDENAAATGDLDILESVNIVGGGADLTILDGGDLDRVFHINPGIGADISGVTIQNGNADTDGGGILVDFGGALTVTGSTIRENEATLSIGIVGKGGGIYNFWGVVNLLQSTISDNIAQDGGGGLGSVGGPFLVDMSVIRAIRRWTGVAGFITSPA